ncbi:MAG: very short patch repair endonuclease [Terracidiphilus sp.]
MELSETRRRTMQAVRSSDTGPEMIVRRMLHAAGYRYRLHVKSLPGCPDLVFPSRRKALFINGCFWHGHSCLRGSRGPKANRQYWEKKIARNRERDLRSIEELLALGWQVRTLWECEIKSIDLGVLKRFIDEEAG